MNETCRFEFKTKEELSYTIRELSKGTWTNLPEHNEFFQEMADLVSRMKDKLEWWSQSTSGTSR